MSTATALQERSEGVAALEALHSVRSVQDEIDAYRDKGEAPPHELLAKQDRAFGDYYRDAFAREARAGALERVDDSDTELRLDALPDVRDTKPLPVSTRTVGNHSGRITRQTAGLPDYREGRAKLLSNQLTELDVVPPDGRDMWDFDGSHIQALVSEKDLDARAHGTGTAAAGGNLFIADWVNEFYSKVEQYDGFMKTMPTTILTDHGRDLKFPALAQFGTAALVAEAGTLAGNDMTFAQYTLGAYKIGRWTKVSRELYDETELPLDAILAADFGRSVAKVADNWFVNGTGTVQPFGIASGTLGSVVGTTGVAGVPNFDNLIDLVYAVNHDVLMENNCCFLMAHETVGKIAKLKDGDGQYLWRPTLTESRPMEILGHPIKTSPHVEATGLNKFSVYFGDFRRAMVVRQVNSARFERSNHFAFNTDETALRITTRVDSVLRDSTAVVRFKGGAS